MALPTFDIFRSTKIAQGATEVLERVWQPGAVVQTHTHPFDADALLVAGEMWLEVAGEERHLGPGETFQLARGVPHSERYGDQGATLWVARKLG
jgi:quercetin dioxygenase-like cupin family protein